MLLQGAQTGAGGLSPLTLTTEYMLDALLRIYVVLTYGRVKRHTCVILPIYCMSFCPT